MTFSITILKTGFSQSGGAEKYARLLAHAFHKKGAIVTVLTTGHVDDSFPFEVVSLSTSSKTSLSKVWEFDLFCQKFLKENPNDIVFGLDRNRFQTHLRASSGTHRSYLRHRSRYEPKWKTIRHFLNPLHTSLLHIEKTAFENPDLEILFTNSNLVRGEVLMHYDVNPEKIQVIHNGVEWNELKIPFEESLQITKKTPYQFLFVGNNFDRKGLRPLLYGLQNQSNFHLTVVGYEKNLGSYQGLAEKLGIAKHVSFVGPQRGIIPHLQQADCLVIPSYYDPFANVTVEALAMGLFVISSASNGGSEILTEDTGVILNRLDDQQEMRSALIRAQNLPKTRERAQEIRNSIRYLDFSTQLNGYLEACFSPTLSSV